MHTISDGACPMIDALMRRLGMHTISDGGCPMMEFHALWGRYSTLERLTQVRAFPGPPQELVPPKPVCNY